VAFPPNISDFASNGEHPVIRLPFSVLINGRSYAGTGLSIVGAQATGLAEPHLDGKVHFAILVFNFPGYAISLPVQAAVSAGNPEAGTVSLRFVEPTGPHLPQLRYVLNSFVAGELASVEGSLRATARVSSGAKPAARANRVSFLGAVGGGIRWAVLLLLAAGLLTFVGSKLYERLFVMPLPGLSSVALQGTSLRAISSGQIDYVNPAAKSGEVAFAIRTNSGDTLAISMPCDCVVAPGHAVGGATVLAGEPVMTVAAPNAPVVISTQLDDHALRLLAGGAVAEVQLPDGRVVQASLDNSQLPGILRSATQGSAIPANLVPSTPLAADAVGTPVDVRIKADPMGTFRHAFTNFFAQVIPGFGTKAPVAEANGAVK
jgi:hypothetical protein